MEKSSIKICVIYELNFILKCAAYMDMQIHINCEMLTVITSRK